MNYSPGDYCTQHPAPAWRDRANFICLARLDEVPARWEQLWVRRDEGGLYLVCCIPFFVYDLALGDVVELDESNILKGVVRGGGNVTLRVWFGESTKADRDRLIERLLSKPCVFEWSSENLLALSCADGGDTSDLVDFLQREEGLGSLTYETGKTIREP